MNWEEYRNKVKAEDPAAARDIEDAELCAPVLSAMIRKREELGMSRRELAEKCGLSESSVRRIESFEISPKIDTLLRILWSLGLGLSVTSAAGR
jgi:ribosome-binding protein aMBF1 (putative translation factor)